MNVLLERIQQKIWEQPAPDDPTMCPYCGGLGVIGVNVPYDHPAFGKAFRCACQKQAIVARRWGAAGVPLHRVHCSFEFFDAQPASMRQGKEEARQYAGRLAAGEVLIWQETERNSLLLGGDTGLGKSSLMACIASAWIARGIDVLWCDFNEFIEALIDSYQDGSETRTADITGPTQRAGLLCLDDFGDVASAKEVSDHTRRAAYNVLRHRYENELPTVITTNLNYVQMTRQFGKRITERVYEMCAWVTLSGANFRLGA